MQDRSLNSILASLLGVAALIWVLTSVSVPVQAQSPQTVRVRGTVVSLDGNALVVKSRNGETVPIRLTDSWSASGGSQGGFSRYQARHLHWDSSNATT